MTPITCAKPSPPRGRSPSSPTTRHVRSNIRSTSISMPSAISWNAASQNSSSSAASQPASKRPPEITGPSSLSRPSSYGCDKCPHHLGESKGALKNTAKIGTNHLDCRRLIPPEDTTAKSSWHHEDRRPTPGLSCNVPDVFVEPR